MSQDETESNRLAGDAQAFEYVVGTMPHDERAAFEHACLDDLELQKEVQLWEEQFMSIQDASLKEPSAATWSAIEASIQGAPTRTESNALSFASLFASFFASLWQRSSGVFAVLWIATLGVWAYQSGVAPIMDEPNTDYVAVLNSQGEEQPVLTVLTSSDGANLWLKWEKDATEVAEILQGEKSLQLWAQSRRDGQIRPLVVFEDSTPRELSLDEATWRLIKDSSHLILTEEEEGGSAIDEPSEELVAKGICIRFSDAIKPT